MKFILHPTKDKTRKTLGCDEIKRPWPKAKITKENKYETWDGTGDMIFEVGDEVEICGRYLDDYIMLVDNHLGRKEELLIEINDVDLI